MKPFLILLLACVPFFASSQDTLVTIKPEVARFFLEQNEKVKIHTEKDSLQDILIQNLRETLSTKDDIISTYELDELYYDMIITNHEKIEESLTQQLRRQKRLKWVGYILAVGVVMLAL